MPPFNLLPLQQISIQQVVNSETQVVNWKTVKPFQKGFCIFAAHMTTCITFTHYNENIIWNKDLTHQKLYCIVKMYF